MIPSTVGFRRDSEAWKLIVVGERKKTQKLSRTTEILREIEDLKKFIVSVPIDIL